MKEISASLGPVQYTGRGFEIILFEDRYKTPCSLQVSSLADYAKPGTSALFLGTEDAEPKVLASEAYKLGIETDTQVGWVPYPIPAEVSLTTRAHLSREQVAALILHLKSWLDNDTLEIH